MLTFRHIKKNSDSNRNFPVNQEMLILVIILELKDMVVCVLLLNRIILSLLFIDFPQS